MARLEAIVAGTGVIPSYGISLLDEDALQAMARQLVGSKVPMLLDHDLDRPLEVTVLRAEVRDGSTGDRQLFVEYEVPDDQVALIGERMGMSVAFTRRLIGPDETTPDARLWVDPGHYNRHELLAAVHRLNRAGFTPEGGAYLQLSEVPPATVVFEIAWAFFVQIGVGVAANAIYDGLKILLHREHKTRFRFVLHKDADTVTAEIETSSEAALRDALKALVELDQANDGLFVREARKWRKAGTGGSARRADLRKRRKRS